MGCSSLGSTSHRAHTTQPFLISALMIKIYSAVFDGGASLQVFEEYVVLPFLLSFFPKHFAMS
jgi:hypothetical protein